MPYKQPFAAFAAAFVLAASVAAGTAFAQQTRSLPATAAPQAADQTLGVAIMSAHVDRDGTLLGGAGVVGASKQQNGRYFVAFNRSVEGCTYSGAVSGPLAFLYSGFVTTLGTSGTFNGATYYGVQADTSDHNTFIGDRPFHLIVFCAE